MTFIPRVAFIFYVHYVQCCTLDTLVLIVVVLRPCCLVHYFCYQTWKGSNFFVIFLGIVPDLFSSKTAFLKKLCEKILSILCGLFFCEFLKVSWNQKADWRAVDSPKEWTDEFDLFTVKSKKANKTNSSVHFLGEVSRP